MEAAASSPKSAPRRRGVEAASGGCGSGAGSGPTEEAGGASDPISSRLEARLALAARIQEEHGIGCTFLRGVDLFLLSQALLKRGGVENVAKNGLWQECALELYLPKRTYSRKLLRVISQKFLATPEVVQMSNLELQEAGAVATHFNPRALMPEELLIFKEFGYESNPEKRTKFLEYRNHILLYWVRNMKRELLLEEDILQPLFNRFGQDSVDAILMVRIFQFLDTNGSINWGVFTRATRIPRTFVPGRKKFSGTNKKVVVIGAGLAGLAAATQLDRWGYKVTIMEGRGRVGGRVFTDHESFDGAPVDLGAMLITGGIAHPAHTLCVQLGQPLHEVTTKCPLYFSDGRKDTLAPKEVDQAAEEIFSKASEHAFEKKYALLLREDLKERVDLTSLREKLVDEEIDAQEKRSALEKQYIRTKFEGSILESAKRAPEIPRLESAQPLPSRKFETAESVFKLSPDMPRHVLIESLKCSNAQDLTRSLPESLKKYDKAISIAKQDAESVQFRFTKQMLKYWRQDLQGIVDTCEHSVAIGKEAMKHVEKLDVELRRVCYKDFVRKRLRADMMPDIDVLDEKVLQKYDFPLQAALYHFLVEKNNTEDEKALLHWHMANLEYACATSLRNVSNTNWDQDDEYSFEGPHYLLPNGFSMLAYGMAQQIRQNIEFQAQVVTVSYTNDTDPVGISYRNRNGALKSMVADAVIVTVPLGILKRKEIEFIPELPESKLNAIRRLGYGNLNKVSVEFASVFWDENVDVCGRVVSASDATEMRLSHAFSYEETRGEFFTFWALNRYLKDKRPILTFLVAGMAAENLEKEPEDKAVIQCLVKLLRKMYPRKEVSKPIRAVITRWASDPMSRGAYSYVAIGSTGNEYDMLAEQVEGKVFFAGEATSREHPATTGGAIFSGLREACKVAIEYGRTMQATKFQASWTFDLDWHGIEARKTLKETDDYIENVFSRSDLKENDEENDNNDDSNLATALVSDSKKLMKTRGASPKQKKRKRSPRSKESAMMQEEYVSVDEEDLEDDDDEDSGGNNGTTRGRSGLKSKYLKKEEAIRKVTLAEVTRELYPRRVQKLSKGKVRIGPPGSIDQTSTWEVMEKEALKPQKLSDGGKSSIEKRFMSSLFSSSGTNGNHV